MSWNYRLVKWDNDTVSLHEVYYNPNGTVYAYTEHPYAMWENEVEAIRDLHRMFEGSVDKSTLTWEDLPSAGPNMSEFDLEYVLRCLEATPRFAEMRRELYKHFSPSGYKDPETGENLPLEESQVALEDFEDELIAIVIKLAQKAMGRR